MSTQGNHNPDHNPEKSAPRTHRSGFWDRLIHAPAGRLAWLWLAAGFILLLFTFFQAVLWAAAWLAPIFLLRFVRTSRHSWVSLPLVFLTYVLAINFASHGLPFSLLGLIGNVLFKGLMWMLPYAADRWLARRLQGWSRSLIFPLAFTTIDWVLSVLRVSSTGSPAYSQAGNLVLLQVLSITSMWVITFLIMWFAALINQLWEHAFAWGTLRNQLIAFAAVLAGVLLFGGVRLAYNPPAQATVETATITIDSALIDQGIHGIDWVTLNPSIDAQRAALRSIFQATVNDMLAKTETALVGGAKIVSWQEASGWVLEEDKQSMLDQASSLARQFNAAIQISLSILTRTQAILLRNQSILIDPAGQVQWTYDKTHPVPYDEAMFTIAGPGILPLVNSSYGRLSTAICYDTYYPALIRQAGEGDADILFAPSNEAAAFPWAISALAISDYRAIENGFAIIRPTGNGISAVIDPYGRILAQVDYFTNNTGIMLTSVPTRGVTTIYSRIGDLFAYLCAAGLVFLAAWAVLSPAGQK
jgi:apolipoprotein N-acyltransferase